MKKLIAAAVATAVIAPMTAIAAGPTLYGKIQMSVNYLDNKGDNPGKYKEWSLNSNHSRIGVKGSEDIGNGMKVGYLIEWNVDMDGDQTDLGERNRAVTLSGDWGTALAGKWDTPLKTLGRKLDLFGERLGDTRNMNTGAVIDVRTPNTIAYVTPNMSGFSATLAYVFDAEQLSGTNSADDTDYNAYSINGIYNNGPLLLGAAYENMTDNLFGPNAENQAVWRLGGSYKFGDFKILGSYTGVSDAAGMDGKDTSIWSLGGAYAMGNNTIKLQWSMRDEYDDWKVGGVKVNDIGKDTGANNWAIGLDHAMSKRTTVYVEYGQVSNDDNSSSRTWSQLQNSAAAGRDSVTGDFEDNTGFGIGIIHKF